MPVLLAFASIGFGAPLAGSWLPPARPTGSI